MRQSREPTDSPSCHRGATWHDADSSSGRPTSPRYRRLDEAYSHWSLAVVVLAAAPARAERVTVPLNGTWQIADSVAAEPAPKAFRATVAVPGLVHNATPAFAGRGRLRQPGARRTTRSPRSSCRSRHASRRPGVSPPGAQLLLVPAHVRRPRAGRRWRPCASTRPSSGPRSGSTAEGRRVRRAASRPGSSTSRPAMRWQGENVLLVRDRRAPRRPARDLPGGDRLREAEVDARHLRRGVAPAGGQPRDRERPGGAADRLVRDPRGDEGPQPRDGSGHLRAGAGREGVEGRGSRGGGRARRP